MSRSRSVLTGRCSSAALPRAWTGSSAEVVSDCGPANLATHSEEIMNKKIILGLAVAAFAFAGIAVVPAGGAAGRHTHPGAETGYVLEGELELIIDGKPPMKIKAGESYQIPEGAIHDAKAGDKPFKVLGVYVVKAGEPLAK